MKYFKLKPEIYLIKGKKRALLQNLIEKRIIWLNEEVSRILRKSEFNEMLTEDELFELKPLVDNEWGVFSDKKIFSDKLRLLNVFNEKKFHKNTPNIINAVLQISNECNKNCEFCGKIFCPSCFKKSDLTETLSLQYWKTVIRNLKKYGAGKVLLTGGEPALSPVLEDIVNELRMEKIDFSIHTNGLKKIEFLPYDTHIMVTLYDESDIIAIMDNYREFTDVTIILTKSISDETKEMLPNNWVKITGSIEHIPVTKDTMINKGFEEFSMRRMFDKCLYGKAFISHDGEVYPCFQSEKSLGNIKNRDWHLIIKRLVEDYWKVNIDQWDSVKCKACEFRYACNSCRFYNAEEYCNYDMEVCKWK